MKKLLFSMFILSIALLVGCTENQIIYDGKVRTVSEVEEIIADQLEAENPDLDLEVDILEEAED